jgi:AraC family transcriptional regulator of adaptative response/methylated-DNA-[protein]-cysteine methyltransferase
MPKQASVVAQVSNFQKPDQRWQSVVHNDANADGHFVYAVVSTGIFCRPSCKSRRPNRENVQFYELPEAALAAGFRACKRCRPEHINPVDPRLASLRKACGLLAAADEMPPASAELASRCGLSERSMRRLFIDFLGITSRQYWDALRVRRLKANLRAGEAVACAAYGAGYGAASRLYENARDRLGMTPATYGKGGKGAHIRYTLFTDEIGKVIIAATQTGVCFLGLGTDPQHLITELQQDFPAATLAHDDAALVDYVAVVRAYLAAGAPHPDLPLDIRWTAFQRRVWRALMDIPVGETRSYRQIADHIGAPKAVRAVGRACASNPVSLLVPCHRAVGSDGSLRGYRWGLARKQRLLDHEAT